MSVGGVDPARGGDRDEVVTEVHERVDQRPVVESVCQVVGAALNQSGNKQK